MYLIVFALLCSPLYVNAGPANYNGGMTCKKWCKLHAQHNKSAIAKWKNRVSGLNKRQKKKACIKGYLYNEIKDLKNYDKLVGQDRTRYKVKRERLMTSQCGGASCNRATIKGYRTLYGGKKAPIYDQYEYCQGSNTKHYNGRRGLDIQ